jgi:hypothetical protein
MNKAYYDLLTDRQLSAGVARLVCQLQERAGVQERLLANAVRVAEERNRARQEKKGAVGWQARGGQTPKKEDSEQTTKAILKQLGKIESEELLVAIALNSERQALSLLKGLSRLAAAPDRELFDPVLDFQQQTISLLETAFHDSGWDLPVSVAKP